MLVRFLEALYQNCPEGFISLWERQIQGSKHVDVSLPNWKELVEKLAQRWDSEKRDVYFGVALRGADLGSGKRGGKKEVVCLPAFFADIDIGTVGHKGKRYPSSLDEAVSKILMPFAARTGFAPTFVIHTSGGIHVYWCFDKPLVVTDANRKYVDEALKDWQLRLIQLAAESGYAMDDTAELSRVLRLPGTNNWKTGEPRPVTILAGPAARYPFEALCSAPAPKAEPVVEVSVADGKDEDTRLTSEILDNLRAKLKASKNPERRSIIKDILAGKPFAPHGERDRALQRAASWVAWIEPEAAPEIVAELFVPSLEAMEAESPDDYLTFEDAVKKIERAQGDARRARAEEKARHEGILRGLQKGSGLTPREHPVEVIPAPTDQLATSERTSPSNATDPTSAAGGTVPPSSTATPASTALVTAGPTGPLAPNAPEILLGRPVYTPEEMGDFRLDQERVSKQPISVDQWRRRWIIQKGEFFYVYGPKGYGKPIARGELEVSLPRDLSPLPPAYFAWKKMTGDGIFRDKTPTEILKELATVATGIVSLMTAEKSYYDADTQTFYEVCAPLRQLEPVFDEQCDRWLRILGGSKQEKLLDWLATLSDLRRPSSALFITGKSGTGKNMLAIAASRLWTNSGFTPMAEVLSGWEENLQKCPLVVADEELPKQFNGTMSTEALRALITTESRPLHRKFMPNADLRGNVRVMLLANKEDMIQIGDENLGKDALEAVAARFLHVRASAEASQYLVEIGGRNGKGDLKGTSDWIEDGDRLTKHLFWLKENRKVAYGNRFVVEGDLGEMKKKLAIQGSVPSLVAQFVVRFLENPKKYNKLLVEKPIVVQDGQIYVSASSLCDSWELLGGHRGAPLLKTVNMALENMAVGDHQDRVRVGTGPQSTYKRYWRVDPEYLFAFAENNTAVDVDVVKENIRNFVTLGVVDGGKKSAPADKSDLISNLLKQK